MIGSSRAWLILSATLLAIVSATLMLPLSGEFVTGMAITLLAAFIIAL